MKTIFPLLFSILFLGSCKEDFFEATVTVDIPEHTPSLAVTSEIFAGDSLVAVYVTQSVGILEDIPYEPIKNATVELLKDGQPYLTLPYYDGEQSFDSKFYVAELPEPFSFENSEYELKVSAPNFEAISSKQVMPEAVEIISAEYETDGAINSEGDRVDEFKIAFQDPPGVENYYRLEIWLAEGEFNPGFRMYVENLEPLGEEFDGNLFLKDSSIDGKKYTWRIGSYNFMQDDDLKFRIELFSITRDQYLFARSASLSADNDDNPFAEPVIVHGNIEGGNGIFSLGTKSTAIIEL